MRDIQLYAKDTFGNFQRLELFSGDSITVTESIRNAKDIAKVFTTFSQQFLVPASKVNNKFFRHYYNYNIDYAASATNAFDARRKIDSRIEINSIPFKSGKLALDGVDMRNNKPYAYRITFYGSIVDLKDLLGEDKLPSLTVGDNNLDIDKDYNPTAIKNALTAEGGISADGTIVPLITTSQVLYYDSSQESEQSGNLYYGTVNQGVKFDQLKYAIKLTKIIEAIESKYSEITFAPQSFFKAADQYDFNQLYMWCHRKKGKDTIEAGAEVIVPFVDQPEGDKFTSVTDNIISIDETGVDDIDIDFIVDANSSEAIYDIILYSKPPSSSTFSVLQRKDRVSGTNSLGFGIGTPQLISGTQLKVYVRTYEQAVTFTEIEIELTKELGGGSEETDTYDVTDVTFDAGFVFNIAKNLPDMKVIDFLSSLFKMFNLVAYVNGNEQIEVQTLDEFYSTGEIDITKYIDIERSQVNAALPYKEIIFGYEDTKTILAQQHYQEIAQVDAATGRGPFEWGAVEYSDVEGELSGGTYKVQPSFHHMKFEKLIDRSNNEDTQVQVGVFIDDNEETYLGQPLLFYAEIFNPSITLGFLTREGRVSFGTASVYLPSNYRIINNNDSETTHFNPERNEFTNVIGNSTLFSRYYQSYIENIFDKKTRIIKVSSVLPVNILIQIELSDVILLNGQKYRINSYKANLITGRTDFELINYYD